MAYTYYNSYKIYYDSLKNKQNIVNDSNSLVSDCTNNTQTIITTYFNKMLESKWEENGKKIVIANIVVGLENKIDKLNQFIEKKLVKACSMSINELLPIVEDIKEGDEKLYQLQGELAGLQLSLARTPRTLTDYYGYDRKGNVLSREYPNPYYFALLRDISNKEEEIKNQHTYLIGKCNEANAKISSILALNGNLSQSQITSMLPIYEEFIFDVDDGTVETETTGVISNVELEKGKNCDRLLVTIDGRVLPIWRQYSCGLLKTKDGTINLARSGCSILAASSAFAYLSGRTDATVEEIYKAMGTGQWTGISKLFGVPGVKKGELPITEDVVEKRKGPEIKIGDDKYQIYATASASKLNPRAGDFEDFEKFVKTTIDNDGVVIMGVARALNQSGRVKTDLREMTGIESNGGHLINIVDIDENGYLIFSDSAFSDYNPENGTSVAYDKGITVEEFYDNYIKGATGKSGKEYYEYVMGVYDVELVPIN